MGGYLLRNFAKGRGLTMHSLSCVLLFATLVGVTACAAATPLPLPAEPRDTGYGTAETPTPSQRATAPAQRDLFPAATQAPTSVLPLPPEPPPMPPGADIPTPPPVPGVVPAEPVLPSGSQAVVKLASQDLSQRLSLAEVEIRVVSVEPRDWPDTSLGCPQPGMVYLQVITPGYLVILEAGGRRYEYHTDRQRAILCARAGSQVRCT